MRCSLWIWPPLHCAMCQMHWLTSQSTCTRRVQRSKAQWQRQEIALHNQSWHQNPQLMTCLSPPPPPGHGQLTRPKTPWRVCHPIPAREFWHYWIWSYPVCAMSCQFMEGAITRTSPSLECSHSAWKQETDKERFTYIYIREEFWNMHLLMTKFAHSGWRCLADRTLKSSWYLTGMQVLKRYKGSCTW